MSTGSPNIDNVQEAVVHRLLLRRAVVLASVGVVVLACAAVAEAQCDSGDVGNRTQSCDVCSGTNPDELITCEQSAKYGPS